MKAVLRELGLTFAMLTWIMMAVTVALLWMAVNQRLECS